MFVGVGRCHERSVLSGISSPVSYQKGSSCMEYNRNERKRKGPEICHVLSVSNIYTLPYVTIRKVLSTHC